MINRNIFCSRKGGATIDGKFFPQVTSNILSIELERKNNTMQARAIKREKKNAITR